MLTLAGLSDSITRELSTFAARCFSQPYDLLRGDPRALFHNIAAVSALIVLPVAVAAALGGLALGVAEAGYHPNMELAAPKWNRLDPLPKLKQMFMLQETAVDIVLQLARVVVVGAVAYSSVESAFPRLMKLSRVGVQSGAAEVIMSLFKLALWSSLALAALALVDYIKSWRKPEASIRMCRQE